MGLNGDQIAKVHLESVGKGVDIYAKGVQLLDPTGLSTMARSAMGGNPHGVLIGMAGIPVGSKTTTETAVIVREIEASGKVGAKLALTDIQKQALPNNIEAIKKSTLQFARENRATGAKSLLSQSELKRWRYLDQLPVRRKKCFVAFSTNSVSILSGRKCLPYDSRNKRSRASTQRNHDTW